MRERPILMSAPMVRALLKGTKTQTRRVALHTLCGVRVARLACDPAPDVRACPYGAPGDRLWVRESAWLYGQWWKDGFTSRGRQRWTFSMAFGQQVRYERPHDDELTFYGSAHPGFAFRPSIHMPRWASRLTLRITDVRVERLQEISADDCRSEGHPTDWSRSPAPEVHDDAARDWYRDLWDSLNAARGYGWDANPWVWVVEFERLDCADDCPPGHCACHDGDARTVNRTHTADAAGEGDA